MRRVIPGGREPLGKRIVELPENEAALLNRDSHSGYVAYVPTGSIAAGKALVMAGASGTAIPCNTCHGPLLTGFGAMPPLAGRPPAYLVRQLWAFQSGERHGAMAGAMRAVASRLSTDEMLAIAAYVASLPVGGRRVAVTPKHTARGHKYLLMNGRRCPFIRRYLCPLRCPVWL